MRHRELTFKVALLLICLIFSARARVRARRRAGKIKI
jgi:hypothetical protein